MRGRHYAVELRQLLADIADKYDPTLDQQSEAAMLLRSAKDKLADYVPNDYIVKGSSGQSSMAAVPWIAVFDPEETTSATHGMYVVYLFAADMRTIYLTLIQGTEDLRNEAKGKALDLLTQQAEAIRNSMSPDLRVGTVDKIYLAAPRRIVRPRHYEAGTIVAKPYPIGKLPGDDLLRSDLAHFLRLCDHAIGLRHELALTNPGVIATRVPAPRLDFNVDFKPKNDAKYSQVVTARKLTKTRRHETLLQDFNAHLKSLGYKTGSPHPIDLHAIGHGAEWIVEAKIVRRGDGQRATREALAQLVEYIYFYCRHSHVRMLALFNESIGDAFVELLESLDISSVWRDGSTWSGSSSALAAGLCS